jgi:hypothetical protein
MGDPVDPVDRALRDLDASWNEELDARPAADDRGGNDRTILGVGTPRPTSAAGAPSPSPSPTPTPSAVAAPKPFAQLQPRTRRPSDEPQPALVHSERSPLSFVMRASESSPGPKKDQSHDMSMFVEALVADTSPVVEPAPAATAMEPVMRRARKRRHWIIASTIAATAIAGALVGMHFGATADSPRLAANQLSADVALQSPPPATAPMPTQPTAAAPTAPQTVEEVAPAPATDAAPPTVTAVVAISKTTTKTRTATKTTAKTKPSAKKVAPKKVATANTTAKKSAKKPSPKKPAIAKKTTAKKPTPAKKAASTKTRR